MRPLRLELEGFTAFRSHTVVDFEGVELFALTGATGSGKTSILDAMVFALYGNVPRLADQRAVAPVIAQGMAEARVRLDFTIGADEYSATRVVRRTKTGGGTTAEARLEHGGEVLAGTADEVNEAITELLGLRYDHFTKCVVLPQGEFARFLHDKPKDRQDLLVSLLDLGLYGRMAELAGQRAAGAKRDADVLDGRLGDLAGATDEALAAAATRVTELEALVAHVREAVTALAATAGAADAARARAAQLSADVERLRAIAVPEGVDELHERVQDAARAVERASTTLRDAEAARAIADAALAALPDRGDMVVCRDAHDRRAALQERQEKGRLVVDERRADEAAAAAAAVAAEATLREAVAADEAARAAHRAHAVRADLVAGEPCPVCRQIVTTVPDEPTPPALRTSEQRRARAERDHRAATDARGAAQKALAGAEATMAHLVAEVEAVTRELAGAPSRDEAVAAIAAVDEARAACEKASATATAARDALAAATTAQARAVDDERDAQVRFDTARDAVADLHPPARLGAGASLVDQWRLLAEWATGAAAAGDDDVGRVEKEVAALERERAAQTEAVTARCRDAGVTVAVGGDLVSAVQQALGRAIADRDQLEQSMARAAALRTELATVKAQHDVARSLATHLDARHFEKWVLDEAMAALAEGATELLGTLSGGQYALRVDGRTGSFLVVDHRNADETRSARTLSGGETFLASLALALALADRVTDVAARGAVQLESMFLDEGFGTLDPDTLDVVASAIEELGASGRMVGIVSHVADLGERLPVRYEVRRAGNASTVERIDR